MKKYPEGYCRYELILYKDVKTNGKWDTTIIPIIPKTEDIKKVKKVIPDAEELMEQEENNGKAMN